MKMTSKISIQNDTIKDHSTEAYFSSLNHGNEERNKYNEIKIKNFQKDIKKKYQVGSVIKNY